ncbi:rhomboid family intramembrane serine protease [Epibacterium ulvae]|uniref:rhomboid family intramembrane serine protease n=1 Tax=Epibacterium ulvae TaxID=1156985 RepID=UPI001BFC7D77|nr:rhomboid family intramembrane serine protease [Epibacterium ulvae]MBT8154565.1 rhomboid family intramembrane serine protease [Epibacterium ulvae]
MSWPNLSHLFALDLLAPPVSGRRLLAGGLVWGLMALCCAAEALFQIQSAGWLSEARGETLAAIVPGRGLALQYAGFWPGLLDNWRPNYPGQPVAMFVTYGLLHADLWHLLGNMILLLLLGRRVVEEAGQAGLGLLLLGSVVAGGAAYGVLATSPQPMVGLSGGLFGLIGACQLWHGLDLYRAKAPLRRVILFTLWLILLNFLFWVLQNGGLAWQAHLGGYLGGGLLALVLPMRQAAARPSHHKVVK